MKPDSKSIIRWSISSGIAIALTFLFYAYNNHNFHELKTQTVIWCDSFFCAAVLFLVAGGITLVSKHGGFNALGFATKKLFDRIRNPKNPDPTYHSYYEYVQEKQKNSSGHFAHLLVTGAVLLAVSLILVFIRP